MKTNKKNKGRGLIILGLVLLILGISILFYLKDKNKRQQAEALAVERQMAQGQMTQEDLPEDLVLPEGEVRELPGNIDVESLDKGDSIESEKAIGVIRIDKMDALLQIFDNTSERALLDGVGVVATTDPPSSQKGTICVLAGHRGSYRGLRYFLDIEKLDIGDEIKITTPKEILHYEIVEEEVIEPTDWSKFTREEDRTKLFLMTCHPYPKNDKRLLVKADLVFFSENE